MLPPCDDSRNSDEPTPANPGFNADPGRCLLIAAGQALDLIRYDGEEAFDLDQLCEVFGLDADAERDGMADHLWDALTTTTDGRDLLPRVWLTEWLLAVDRAAVRPEAVLRLAEFQAIMSGLLDGSVVAAEVGASLELVA